jgi:hypothetical protein
MKTDTLIWMWILEYPIGLFEVRTQKNDVFGFISVLYTITDIQAPETH